MNSESRDRRLSSMAADNRVLRLAVVFLLVVNVALGFGLVFRKQIVTIIPSNVMTKATYTADSADEGALSSWGMYVADLIGNVTPSNADFVAAQVGHILSPAIYKSVMSDLADQVTKIKENQLTLQFDPAEVKFNPAKNAVYVDGWLTTTDAHGSSHREERTYEMYFNVVDYQPRLVGLTSYPGSPHYGE